MKAAIVRGPGQAPVLDQFDEPVAGAGEHRVAVAASALAPLVRARASGTHYSSGSSFPFVVGVDGVGRLENGERVYFLMPRAPFGAMAERTVAPAEHCIGVPPGLDDITAAAIANPGMSSWAALTERARLRPGETVLINGATGASGRLAVKIARHLGAARVIATGRNRLVLDTLRADVTIPLDQSGEELQRAFDGEFAAGIDIVVDYLWGSTAEALLRSAASAGRPGVPMRLVQVGTASGAEIALPGAALRSSGIELIGSGVGSLSLAALLKSVREMFEAAEAAGLSFPVRTVPLDDLEDAWSRQDPRRIVFTP